MIKFLLDFCLVLLQEIIHKLGADLVLKWAIFANSIEHRNIFHFSDWLFQIAEAACKITNSIILTDDAKPFRKRGSLNTYAHENTQDKSADFQNTI